MIAIVAAWTTAFFWANVFECHTHFDAIWSTDSRYTHAVCIPIPKILLPFAWSDIATDILILTIPIPMVLQLHKIGRAHV